VIGRGGTDNSSATELVTVNESSTDELTWLSRASEDAVLSTVLETPFCCFDMHL